MCQIKRLRDRNQALETQVKTLTEEKSRLEDCIRNHTYKIDTLEVKLNNMENHNAQEMEKVRLL